MLFTSFNLSAQTADDYPWLNSVLSENCCSNQRATAYDFGHYSFVYIEANENCVSGGKLYFDDGSCWCEDKGGSKCVDSYRLNSLTGIVVYECGDVSSFTPFDQFEWLGSVASIDNCDMNSSITVYLEGAHYYVFVETQNGHGGLYNESGSLLCTSRNNYDCVELYGFSNVSSSWSCGDGQPGEGRNITLRNTLEEDGVEGTYASLFGAADDAFDEFATFSATASEFPTALAQGSDATGLPFDINGLYDIDITATSIEFTLLPDETDPFWINQFGVFPAGKFDRYYFTFSEPHNITSASSNNTSVDLRIDSENVVVVEISEGYDFNPGISFFISLNGAEELSNEDKARAFNTGLINGDPSVIKWIRDDYIQHNLGVPTGKAPIAGFYGGQPTGITVDVHRSFEIGDYVFAQTTLGGTWGQFFGSNTDNILYEVWRFEDGFAVEHWDNIVAVVDDMDGTSQTDGVTTPAIDLEKTDANKALLEDMAQTLFVGGDWTNVRDYFDIDSYVQHSVGAGTDGAFLASLEGQTGVSFYDDVKFIHVLGNFGLVMSQGPDITGQDLEGTYAYYDLFRIDNGKIVEHWDAITLIPPSDQWAHTNGKWGDDAIGGITLRNTLQDPGESEVTYASLFGQADDAYDEFAIRSNSEIEFPTALAQGKDATGLPFDISGLYEVDFTDNSIDFKLLPDENDPFWIQQFGEFPAGKFDRYYFTFSQPHNITRGSSDNTSVSLRINSETVVVVEIGEGYDFNPGISFSVSIE